MIDLIALLRNFPQYLHTLNITKNGMKKANRLFANVNSHKIVHHWFRRRILSIRGWFAWKSGLAYIDRYFSFDYSLKASG